MGYLINTVGEKLKINSLKLNFLPSWWQGNYGLIFGEPYAYDPVYRAETYRKMKSHVRECFPAVIFEDWSREMEAIPPDFGNALIPALAGCEIVFPKVGYPWNKHLEKTSALDLRCPMDLVDAFPFSEIIKQVEYLNNYLGTYENPWLPIRGILNDAFLIEGDPIFIDLYDRKSSADKLLQFCLEVISGTIYANVDRGWENELVVLMNCANMMVSTEFYQELLFPWEYKAYEQITDKGFLFGIHHCGVVDGYLQQYRRFPECRFIEIGWDSDVATTLEVFPESEVQYIFSASFLLNSRKGDIEIYMDSLLSQTQGNWNRFSLVVPDIEYGTPETNIQTIIEMCKR